MAICDLQMRGVPNDLLPGQPLCGPRTTVMVEATVQLLRRLHHYENWTAHINQHMVAKLELIGPLIQDGARTG